MSRIGERKLTIPTGVTASVEGNTITVKGPKGELKLDFSDLIKVAVEDNIVTTKQIKESKRANVMQGTTNSLINNMFYDIASLHKKNIESKEELYLKENANLIVNNFSDRFEYNN